MADFFLIDTYTPDIFSTDVRNLTFCFLDSISKVKKINIVSKYIDNKISNYYTYFTDWNYNSSFYHIHWNSKWTSRDTSGHFWSPNGPFINLPPVSARNKRCLFRYHPYITSAYFWLLYPTNQPYKHTVLNVRISDNFLDPPTQSFCWCNVGMVP